MESAHVRIVRRAFPYLEDAAEQQEDPLAAERIRTALDGSRIRFMPSLGVANGQWALWLQAQFADADGSYRPFVQIDGRNLGVHVSIVSAESGQEAMTLGYFPDAIYDADIADSVPFIPLTWELDAHVA